jgi:hypothetical protein
MRRILFLVMLAACSDPVVVGELQEVAEIKAIPNRDLDLLFVIDNSGSMGLIQDRLAAAFPQMMDVLATVEGGLPNLHIGVITSDMGTSGLEGTPPPTVGAVGIPNGGGCAQGFGDAGTLRSLTPTTNGAAFISDIGLPDGTRERNYTGELRDVFAANAAVGDLGCGFEQHLGAINASLTNPANTGFFRPEANLAVVIVANEDDCSVQNAGAFFDDDIDNMPYKCLSHGLVCDQPLDSEGEKTNCVASSDAVIADVDAFADTLLAFKGDPRMVMAATITGDATNVTLRPYGGSFSGFYVDATCSLTLDGMELGVATPGVRLAAFTDRFEGRSSFASICNDDLTAPMHDFGATAKKLVADPCFDISRLADTSDEPGIQPLCEVRDTRDSSPDKSTSLPLCGATAGDCYELVTDAVACPYTADHLRLAFHRSETPDDLWTSVRCAVR